MNKQTISGRQIVSIAALFIIGSSLILSISSNANEDSWIGFLIAYAAYLPVLYLYMRLLGHYPGKDIFEICLEVFGPVAGRIAIALLVWYAVHLGALVLQNFASFIQVTTFDQMPQVISLMSFAALAIWASRKGVETVARCSLVMLPILVVIVALTFVFLAKEMHPEYLLPVGENLSEVPKDALSDFAYPLGETVMLLGIASSFGGRACGRKFLIGSVIGAVTILVGGFVRNTMVLGFPLMRDSNFPSFHAVSIAVVGGFLSRIEAVITANLLMAGFVKISVCILAASRGMAKLLNADDQSPFVAPLGLLMVALGSIVYQSTREIIQFIDVYKYYALPFQILIPLLLLGVAEIRMAVQRRAARKKEPA